ncbi:hypothetical protein PM082_016806 [Marasmius tenuissimus]|nr:hypothetical protein PM082_016806 [Marasmius tenuissimus]
MFWIFLLFPVESAASSSRASERTGRVFPRFHSFSLSSAIIHPSIIYTRSNSRISTTATHCQYHKQPHTNITIISLTSRTKLGLDSGRELRAYIHVETIDDNENSHLSESSGRIEFKSKNFSCSRFF